MSITRVEFGKDYRIFKKGDVFTFNNGLTTIVGDNGTGKSTLIALVKGLFENEWTLSDVPESDVLVNKSIEEKCTYIDLSWGLLKNQTSALNDSMSIHIASMHSSMGQAAMIQLTEVLESPDTKKNNVIIVDEPERGLSQKSQAFIANYLKSFVLKNPYKQIIVITHSELIMRSLETISTLRMMPTFQEITSRSYTSFYENLGNEIWEKTEQRLG